MDIKPYLPFAQSLPMPVPAMRGSPPAAEMAVSFTAEVEKQALTLEKRYPQLTLFIREVLAPGPRQAYRKGVRKRAETLPSGWCRFNVR
ncbi:hypothetical protein ACNKHX_01235 [Shigella flexneri]